VKAALTIGCLLALAGMAQSKVQITTTSLPAGFVNVAYSQTLSASGGVSPLTWSLTSGKLPTGLSLNAAGTIAGTPAATATSTFTVQVKDATGARATQPLTIAVDPAVAITTSSLPVAVAGVAYSQTLAASGGTPPFQWTLTSGSLPNGITLSTGGSLSGTPPAAGDPTFSVQVMDSNGATASQSLTLTVDPPVTITTVSLPAGTVGQAYSQTLSASGGSGSYTWTLAPGMLPAGLTLSSGGVISGTPSAAAVSNFTVKAVSSGSSATEPLSITINPVPAVTTASLPNGTVGTAYQQTLAASGGTLPYTWAVSAGALPANLSLSAAGSIAGTPSAAGTSSFTVQVTDSVGAKATKALSIVIAPVPLTVTTSSLPGGTVGTAYQQTLAASGGTGGYSWTVTVGALPAVLSLSAAGNITGTPSAAGTSNFTVQVTDSSGAKATKALSIVIAPAPLTITTSSLPNGTVGTAYQQTLAASGGTGGYSWTVTVGALPAVLSLSAAGSITGTPSAAGTSTFTVQVTDSSGAKATKALSIVIAPAPLTITTSSLPGGTVGTAYQQTLAANGGTGGYSWAVTVGALPAVLSLSAAGSITGTPSAAGTSTFTVQVTDSSGAKATQALSIVIAPPQLTITTSSLPNGTVGTAYQQTLAASGGTGGYSWAVTVGALPAVLLLSAAGSITGTPSTAGTSTFTVQVTDSSGAKATQALSIVIAPPQLTITTSSLPNGTVGTAYQQTLAASGGTGGYSWAVTVGALPAVLSLSAAGSITGIPSAAGTSNFTVQVTDSSGAKATQALSIVIAPPQLTITTSSLPSGTVGTAYQQTLTASGGTGGYSWAVTAGALPAVLSLSAAGSITGTPSTAGTSNFTVQVTDSSGAKATQALSIVIAPPQLTVTTSSLPNGTVGTAYQQTLSASGGTLPYSWAVTVGALPAVLSLSAAGSITGTPSAAGTSSFTVQVTDSSGAKATQALSIVIAPPQLTVTTSSLPNGTVGTTYQQTLSASGGASPYSWAVTAGALPAVLSLGPAGSITGTPSTAGTSNFTVQVTDSTGAKATQALSIVIAPSQLTITTSSLPGGTAAITYQQTLVASGGTSPYSWAVIAGSLPAGLSLGPAGSITGAPSAAGTSNFTVQVTDNAGAKATQALSIVIAPSQLTITTSSLPTGTAGTTYQLTTLTAFGGTGGYNWSVTAGSLPAGLSLSPGGGITGTPSAAGTSSFTVQVTDSAAEKTAGAFVITINPALTVTTAPALATGSAGASYSHTFTAQGGVPPYRWAISGTLPAGLSLAAATGVLSGTPTQVGAFPITVQVTDSAPSAPSQASGSYSLQVVSGLAVSTPPVLPSATIGAPYSTTLQAAGGSSPYQWAVTAGSLPGGLNFSGAGQIGGTPTSSGSFTFTAQVTDANSNLATKQFTLAVAGAISVTSASLPAGATQAPYAQTLTATGGTPPYSWSVTAGSLPNGLTLQVPTGALEGTPTAAGVFTFTVTVTDANSVTAQKQFTLSIGTGLTFTSPASLPGATAGASYSFTMQAAGGQPPYSWSIIQGALPDGLSLNAASGLIGGTPATPGTFNFTAQVTDASNIAATRVNSIVVGLPDLPAISISGFSGDMQPLQQPTVNIALSSPFPAPITGTVSLSFAPGGPNPLDDPSIQFSTGGRTATFTIPANATQAAFGASQFAVQTGSVAGTITLTVVSLQAGGSSLPVPDGLLQTVQVNPSPPVIGAIALVHTSGGIELQISGVTDTRELTQVSVAFQPASGTTLQTSQITVPLTAAANAWFQGSSAAPFGGQFSLTLPFTFTGSVSLSSVSAVLSNTAGDSAAASANY
jgi:hypothetical protein